MAQAKVITEQELKRALGMVAGRKHAARDRLALLLTHWAGMRVCEVAALTRGTVLGPAGEVLVEWRLGSDQTKGAIGRVVYANSKLRKELAAYLKANPAPDRSQHAITNDLVRRALHLARTISCRTKRLMVELAANEPYKVGDPALKYITSLSDFLFWRHARLMQASAGTYSGRLANIADIECIK